MLDVAEAEESSRFLAAFSVYVKEQGYACRSLATGKAQSYRFTGPASPLAPAVIEIATTRRGGLPLGQPAQRPEEFDLSALVCEPCLVELLKTYRERYPIEPGLFLPVPKATLLILLKAYAVLNLMGTGRERMREKVHKHLNDILRLTQVLVESDRIEVPVVAHRYLEDFLANKEAYFDRNRLDDCGWKRQKVGAIEEILRALIVAAGR